MTAGAKECDCPRPGFGEECHCRVARWPQLHFASDDWCDCLCHRVPAAPPTSRPVATAARLLTEQECEARETGLSWPSLLSPSTRARLVDLEQMAALARELDDEAARHYGEHLSARLTHLGGRLADAEDWLRMVEDVAAALEGVLGTQPVGGGQ